MIIDFHAHVLPAADHGSDSLETSLRQLTQAAEAGVDVLAATPHFYPHHENLAQFLERRTNAEAALRRALPASSPKLIVGAEVQLCRGLQHLDGLERLCFAGTKTLLLELPPDFSLAELDPTLDALLYKQQVNPVLAHVDRYDPRAIDVLFSRGYRGQLNASALCRLRGRRQCLHWISNGYIVALGSDLHGTQMGYQDFMQALTRLEASRRPMMHSAQQLLGLSST